MIATAFLLLAVITMVSTPDWMKKAVPFGYYRISSEEQSKQDMGKEPIKMQTLQDQRDFVHDELKRKKLPVPKAKHEYYEVKSAKDMNRPQLNKMIEAMFEEHRKGKRVFLAIKDPSRWTRNYTLGEETYAKLYRKNIPIISLLSDGILRHTADEPRPNSDILFHILTGVSTVDNKIKSEKALVKAKALRSQGILSGSARTIYPFALKDPLDVITFNRNRLPPTKKENDGISKAEFGRLIASETGVHGMSPTGYGRFLKDLDVIEAKLSPEEYKQWYDFRAKMRAFFRRRDFDPASSAPTATLSRKKTDFPSLAVWRMIGGYLKEPYSEQFDMPTDEQIAEYVENFPKYLGAKAAKKYRSEVSKRKV
ncbi:MAG: hypothetical protein CMB73_05610 [Euryarchaeota archaeon]|nr:hypothetical protein [Euryarchaeota archaeon]